jgi:hypothetical protein
MLLATGYIAAQDYPAFRYGHSGITAAGGGAPGRIPGSARPGPS